MAKFIPDNMDFSKYMDDTSAKTLVKPASHWMSDISDEIHNPEKHKKDVGYLPWDETKDSFQFRLGEVTVWQGYNGHGKSELSTLASMSLMSQGFKIVIASFEMKPKTTLKRALRMYSGLNPFSSEYQGNPGMIETIDELITDFSLWTDDKLWMYDQVQSVDPKVVFGMIRYCARELGINHVVIDSLMKCVKGEDDYNGQKNFTTTLCQIAKDENIHIHLIHHCKKPPNESVKPGKYDGKGSGAISDQVDNNINVWRNKPKETDVKEKGEASALYNEPDSLLICDKQRNGEDEPVFGLYLERQSHQFTYSESRRIIDFKSYPHMML